MRAGEVGKGLGEMRARIRERKEKGIFLHMQLDLASLFWVTFLCFFFSLFFYSAHIPSLFGL